MSQYEEQFDRRNAICPYCRYEYQVESSDYSEDTREEECSECGKTYLIHQSFSVTTYTTPDCALNAEAHNYKLKTLSTGRSAYFCETCGDCKLSDHATGKKL
jgi:ribosomal protein L32